MADLITQQFILAKNGISITESNMLPDFEREAYLDLVLQFNKRRKDGLSHLVDEN